MPQILNKTLIVGQGALARPIALAQRPRTGPQTAPGIFWLGGFRSDMAGSKALALDEFGAAKGLEVTRFDYSGHGLSGGDFNDGTMSRWLEEAMAVYALTSGPQIIVGSSMGGWLALLLARYLKAQNTTPQALVLIAPAVDMTHDLMLAHFTAAEHAALAQHGYVEQASDYSDTPYRLTKALLDDGQNHLLFGGVIETGCPVAILQGAQDPDVPKEHAMRLLTHLLHDQASFTLIPDGDHRLSRPQDLACLTRTIDQLLQAEA